jgi:hypothetical protein
MRVGKLKDENNLTQLVERLFDLERSTAGRREIAARLAEANDHLDLTRGDFARRLDRGELIAVPEIDGAVPRRTSTGLSTEAARVLLTQTRGRLAGLGRSVVAADEEAVAAAAERLDLTEPARVRRLVGSDTVAREAVMEWRARTRQHAERVAEHTASLDSTLTNATEVLDDLLKRLR